MFCPHDSQSQLLVLDSQWPTACLIYILYMLLLKQQQWPFIFWALWCLDKGWEQIQRQSCVAQLGLITPLFSVQDTVGDVIGEFGSKQGGIFYAFIQKLLKCTVTLNIFSEKPLTCPTSPACSDILLLRVRISGLGKRWGLLAEQCVSEAFSHLPFCLCSSSPMFRETKAWIHDVEDIIQTVNKTVFSVVSVITECTFPTC